MRILFRPDSTPALTKFATPTFNPELRMTGKRRTGRWRVETKTAQPRWLG
jgi:hypothetical protein